MDEIAIVGGLERGRNLHPDADRIGHGQRPTRDHLGECLARHQLHDEAAEAIELGQLVNRRDVWMIEGCQRTGFTAQSREAVRIATERRINELYGDLAAERRVPRAVHLTHAAGAEFGNDLIRTQWRARSKPHWRA